MKCPKCNNDSGVKITRHDPTANETFRLRECRVCKSKFYTVEYEIEKNESFTEIWNTINKK